MSRRLLAAARSVLVDPVRARPPDVPSCVHCVAEVIHCHEVSVEHTDGSTDCVDPWCNLPHHLHDWQLPCDALDPPCPCAPAERPFDDVLPAAA